jgi:hypothetical protein
MVRDDERPLRVDPDRVERVLRPLRVDGVRPEPVRAEVGPVFWLGPVF